MSEVTIVVAAIPNPDEVEAQQAYLKGVAPVLTSFGAETIMKAKIDKALVGDINFEILLVMKLNCREDFESIFHSEKYKELIPYREKGFIKMDIYIADTIL